MGVLLRTEYVDLNYQIARTEENRWLDFQLNICFIDSPSNAVILTSGMRKQGIHGTNPPHPNSGKPIRRTIHGSFLENVTNLSCYFLALLILLARCIVCGGFTRTPDYGVVRPRWHVPQTRHWKPTKSTYGAGRSLALVDISNWWLFIGQDNGSFGNCTWGGVGTCF